VFIEPSIPPDFRRLPSPLTRRPGRLLPQPEAANYHREKPLGLDQEVGPQLGVMRHPAANQQIAFEHPAQAPRIFLRRRL